MSKSCKGIGIGSSVAISKAFLIKDVKFKFEKKSENTVDAEQKIYQDVLKETENQILQIIKITEQNVSKEKADIFRAHLEIIKDESIKDEIIELIDHKNSVSWSINEIFNKYSEMFLSMADSYFRERASDIQDLKKRMLSISCNSPLPDLFLIKEECILVAHDLTPSETAILNKKYVKGFVTNIGGATSHSAIMARTLEIPAIVSMKNITEKLKNGEMIAIDSKNGNVEYSLTKDEENEWIKKMKNYEKEKEQLEKYKNIEAKTEDGVLISIKGNIGQPKDLKKIIENGGQGVGLFRSEFLYMESSEWPSEEEQYSAYKSVLTQMPSYDITIRTLDIGGDKHLSYYAFPKEMNPFLGYRALRLSLKQKDIFETQIKALLKASIYGKLKIMFPMVTTYEEFIEAKNFVKEVEQKLRKEGEKISDDYQIGMMIEIPSAALLADVFAKEAEFFSIGSNDLIQYTHAVDRMSEEVNYLYQPNNPSILNLINIAVKGAKKYDRDISVCGEMAGNPISSLILIGLGIKNLSMSGNSILAMKKLINSVKYSECFDLAKKSLTMTNEKEVVDLVKEFLKNKNIDI